MNVVMGILIPFIGTTLGAGLVYFMKNKINSKIQKTLLGFASGVMIAASVWSLLLPAIDMANDQGKITWIPPTIGFLSGIFFLLIINTLTSRIDSKTNIMEGSKKSKMLFLAVTIHNIPEGMAVGVVFAGFLSGNAGITLASAFALAIGIAIQNFPEGAIISMPLKSDGLTKNKSFLYGTISGIVEPIGASITIYLTSIVVPLLPYLLSFAAGAMIYVVVEELIPESQEGNHSYLGIIGVALGFVIMMILDISLG